MTNGNNLTMPSVVGWSRNDVVRFLPPLNISDKEIDEGLEIYHSVLKQFC